MNIRFSSPLAKLAGQDCIALTIHGFVTIDEVMLMLFREISAEALFGTATAGKPLIPYRCMAIKNGKVLLKPGDLLDDLDELELIPPIMGG